LGVGCLKVVENDLRMVRGWLEDACLLEAEERAGAKWIWVLTVKE